MVVNEIVPKIKSSALSISQDGISAGQSILADINQFVRGNPILSTAVLGATTVGLAATVIQVRKRKKSKPKARRKRKRVGRPVRGRKAKTRRRKKITHRTPRHAGHKIVTFTTKEGKRVKFKVKRPSHSHKRLKRRKR